MEKHSMAEEPHPVEADFDEPKKEIESGAEDATAVKSGAEYECVLADDAESEAESGFEGEPDFIYAEEGSDADEKNDEYKGEDGGEDDSIIGADYDSGEDVSDDADAIDAASAKESSIGSLADEILSLSADSPADKVDEAALEEPKPAAAEEALQVYDDDEWEGPGKPAPKSDKTEAADAALKQAGASSGGEQAARTSSTLPNVGGEQSPPNRRKQAVAGVAILLLVGYCAGRGGDSAQAEREKPAQPQRREAVRTETFSSPELGFRQRSSPPPTAPPPVPVIPAPPPAPPPVQPKALPAAAAEEGPKSFLVALNEVEKEKQEPPPQQTVKAEEKRILPAGVRIQLAMAEPFRSGIASDITAHTTADVKDSQGKVVMPAGSRAVIPFLPYEVNGRVLNDAGSPAVFILPNGEKLSLKGMIKGSDGFPGVSGKVKRFDKGNVFTRMGRTMGRVAGRAVSTQTGGIEGTVVEDTINDGAGGPLIFNSGRVVEVKAGATIFFQVS